MRLYLMQHGDAVKKSVDPERPLSATGVRDVEKVGAFLKKAGVTVPSIWHSGKRRADDTAQRMARYLDANATAVAGLNPNDSPSPMCKGVQRSQDLMVVGHLPHLAKLASLLLTGDEASGVITFVKGGVVCLEDDEAGHWTVRWMVVPSLL